MSAAPAAPPSASAEAPGSASAASAAAEFVRVLFTRMGALCLVELQKLRHDRSELYTRAIQPTLWLVIFGQTFTRLKAIPTGEEGLPYIDFLAPGVLAQSALFISIFFGIQIIWERDAGVLAKLLVTPTPREALIAGKAFAAGIRAFSQVVFVLVLSAILGVGLTTNPLRLAAAAAAVWLAAAFFSCLSMSIAGVVLKRERLMGIGQAIMMPLFFASNALYPVELMPGWLQTVSHFNPLSYEVDALRGLLLGTDAHLAADFAVLIGTAILGIVVAARLLDRLAR
jgi:ABC-2 type transport system permease protein